MHIIFGESPGSEQLPLHDVHGGVTTISNYSWLFLFDRTVTQLDFRVSIHGNFFTVMSDIPGMRVYSTKQMNGELHTSGCLRYPQLWVMTKD